MIDKSYLKSYLKLYAITDGRFWPDIPLEQKVICAIKGGVTMVQYRDKSAGGDERRRRAISLLNICRDNNVPLIINDYVNLAKETGADGVHIGQNDMGIQSARKILGPDKIIGVTAKTVEQAVTAYENGADYLGSGAVFESATKPDAISMDMDLLSSICESVPIPVVAIGGINMDNIGGLSGIPVAGVSVSGGIFGDGNIEMAARRLRGKLEYMRIS